MKKVVLLTILLCTIVSTELLAGMYVKKQVGRDQTEELFLEGGRMKIVLGHAGMGPIQMSIVDTRKERFILVQPARKVYLVTTFDEYRKFLEDMQKQMGMPNPSDMPFAAGEDEEKRGYRGKGETIAGYSTRVLVIEKGGREIERRWVSEEFVKDMLKEIDFERLGTLDASAGTLAAISKAESLKAMAEEMPLKEVNLINRMAATVVKVEHKSLPASTFAPPKGYKKVGMKEYFFPGGNMPFGH